MNLDITDDYTAYDVAYYDYILDMEIPDEVECLIETEADHLIKGNL